MGDPLWVTPSPCARARCERPSLELLRRPLSSDPLGVRVIGRSARLTEDDPFGIMDRIVRDLSFFAVVAFLILIALILIGVMWLVHVTGRTFVALVRRRPTPRAEKLAARKRAAENAARDQQRRSDRAFVDLYQRELARWLKDERMLARRWSELRSESSGNQPARQAERSRPPLAPDFEEARRWLTDIGVEISKHTAAVAGPRSDNSIRSWRLALFEAEYRIAFAQWLDREEHITHFRDRFSEYPSSERRAAIDAHEASMRPPIDPDLERAFDWLAGTDRFESQAERDRVKGRLLDCFPRSRSGRLPRIPIECRDPRAQVVWYFSEPDNDEKRRIRTEFRDAVKAWEREDPYIIEIRRRAQSGVDLPATDLARVVAHLGSRPPEHPDHETAQQWLRALPAFAGHECRDE
jgi:hypothetical protein